MPLPIAIITAIIAIVFIVALIKFWKNKGPMGINPKTVHCPNCGEEVPKIRNPANLRRALWGGYTCPSCGCEIDKYGRENEN